MKVRSFLWVAALIPSVWFLTFLLFCLFEWKPSLSRYFFSDEHHYYALRRQYIPDSDLVMRKNAVPITTDDFRGDLYRDCYGVKIPPLRYEVRFDRNGFRNEAQRERSDIVVVGDSYMEFGLNEQDTFCRRLQKHLGQSVANFGLGWYGPDQYLGLIKKYGLGQKPEKILFCFFEGNDLDDLREFAKWKRGGWYWHFNLPDDFLKRYKTAMADTAAYVRLHLWRMTQKGRRQFASQKTDESQCADRLADLKLGSENVKALFVYRMDPRGSETILRSPELAALGRILSEYKKLAADNGIEPVFLYIPDKTHIYAEYSTLQSGRAWLEIRRSQIFAKLNLETAVKETVEEAGVRYLSLTPVFEEAARSGKFLYYPFDTHWNSEGREIAAEWVAAQLSAG